MFTKTQKITSFLVAGSIAMSGLFVDSPGAVAAEHSGTQSSLSDSQKDTNGNVTPADLPVRPIDDVRLEASQKSLDAEATEFAVGLQELVNAYHELPANLQHKSPDDPQVKGQLEGILGKRTLGKATFRAINPVQAGDGALAIADAASIAVPCANAWKWIKAAGGVITVAEAVNEYFKSKSEDALIKAVGKTAGKELKRALGVQGVIESCKFD